MILTAVAATDSSSVAHPARTDRIPFHRRVFDTANVFSVSECVTLLPASRILAATHRRRSVEARRWRACIKRFGTSDGSHIADPTVPPRRRGSRKDRLSPCETD
jgi:hypothetical protein